MFGKTKRQAQRAAQEQTANLQFEEGLQLLSGGQREKALTLFRSASPFNLYAKIATEYANYAIFFNIKNALERAGFTLTDSSSLHRFQPGSHISLDVFDERSSTSLKAIGEIYIFLPGKKSSDMRYSARYIFRKENLQSLAQGRPRQAVEFASLRDIFIVAKEETLLGTVPEWLKVAGKSLANSLISCGDVLADPDWVAENRGSEKYVNTMFKK
jgi:hypothetical protein